MAVDYYKDGAINPELVTTCAMETAQKFVPNGKPLLKAHQLRKFYGEIKSYEVRIKNSRAENKEAVFDTVLPLIKLLKAKAAYACKRGVVPEGFKKWIFDNVDKVNDLKHFEAFVLYFEAVVGFCYGEAKDNYN